MTPDTAALRPRSRDLKPGDMLVWTGHPRPSDFAKVIRSRKIDDTGWWMTDGSGLADYVWDEGGAWTTVRALCDAADEAERLRARDATVPAVILLDKRTAERDAVRTAHAALVADLRAREAEWHDAWSSVALDDNEAPVLRQVALAWLSARAIVRALLDRHAPEEGS